MWLIYFFHLGYGDLYPTTSLGRFIAIILMYCGLVVLALPISVLGSAFTEEYSKSLSAAKKKVLSYPSKVSKAEVMQTLKELSEEVAVLSQRVQDVACSIESMRDNDSSAAKGEDTNTDDDTTTNIILESTSDVNGIELKDSSSRSSN